MIIVDNISYNIKQLKNTTITTPKTLRKIKYKY